MPEGFRPKLLLARKGPAKDNARRGYPLMKFPTCPKKLVLWDLTGMASPSIRIVIMTIFIMLIKKNREKMPCALIIQPHCCFFSSSMRRVGNRNGVGVGWGVS